MTFKKFLLVPKATQDVVDGDICYTRPMYSKRRNDNKTDMLASSFSYIVASLSLGKFRKFRDDNLSYLYNSFDDRSIATNTNNSVFYDKNALANLYTFNSLNPRVYTHRPGSIERNVVSQILRIIKPADTTKVIVSDMLLDSACGFTGLSICVQPEVICVLYKGHFARITDNNITTANKEQLEVMSDVTKKVKPINALSNKTYAGLVEKVIRHSAKWYEDNTKYKIESLKSSAGTEKYNIKSLSAVVVQDKKVEDKIKAVTDSDIKNLLSNALYDIEKRRKKLELSIGSYKLQLNTYKEQSNNFEYIKKQKDDIGKDLKAIKKMIKDGFIESFSADAEGLTWIYPPMIYDTKRRGIVFLGRVKITLLKEKSNNFFKVRFISYPVGQASTWHADGAQDGEHICLGSFYDTLSALIYSGQIAQVINTMYHYVQSSSYGNRLTNNLDYDDYLYRMNMRNPKVTDDSFAVWSKKNKNTVIATAVMREPEDEDNDEDEEDEDNDD